MHFQAGHHAGTSEIRSWERSLPVLANDLIEAGLDKVEVLMEHALPLSSKRIDVVLAGQHPRTGDASYVVVELKQWSRATPWEDDPQLVIVEGYSAAPKLHPVAQVRAYCQYLQDFTAWLHDQPQAVTGVAYLHNATDPLAVDGLRDYPRDELGQLFVAADRGAWLDYLRAHLDSTVAGAPYADRLINSATAPSKQLLKVAADEVQHRQQFVLLDQQRLASTSSCTRWRRHVAVTTRASCW